MIFPFFFLPIFLRKIMGKSQKPEFLTYLSSQPNWLLGSLIIGILITLVIISVFLYLRFYINKDL